MQSLFGFCVVALVVVVDAFVVVFCSWAERVGVSKMMMNYGFSEY